MAIRVEVREGESIESVMRRFGRVVFREHRRAWAKRKMGYYEKPSRVRRKRNRVCRLNRTGGEGLRFWIGLDRQWRREGRLAILE